MTHITIEKEKLESVLEALESGVKTTADRISWTEYDCELMEQAITALENVLAQPEQNPVAWIHNFIDGGISIGKRPADLNRHPDRWTALYKEPKPCPTCEALARTVMLDQTSHDTTPQPRKPLTRGQIREIEVDVSLNPSFDYITPAEQLCRAIEAAHGIKE